MKPNPSPTLSPESILKSTLGSLLRSHPTLSLTQLHQWLDEAYTQWRDRELGPETYDPQEDLTVFPQDCLDIDLPEIE